MVQSGNLYSELHYQYADIIFIFFLFDKNTVLCMYRVMYYLNFFSIIPCFIHKLISNTNTFLFANNFLQI